MPRPTRLSLLLIPMVIMALSQALPGRAQQAPSARFAFADTTLLRDTLDLHFTRLFPVADSLQMTPDTLRALMIRYRLTMPRILHLADSMSVTVDSVGTFLDRAKLNPLVGNGKTTNAFTYTSGYDIQRTTNTWTNGSQYRLNRGPLYVTNATNIELQRIISSNLTSLRQNREATTEGGFTVNKGLSFGAKAYQLRFFSIDPGSPDTQDENKTEYDFTGRARTNGKRVNTELNLSSGYLNDDNSSVLKRGLSGNLDGRVRYADNGVLTHDLSGSMSGNLSHTRPATLPVELGTRDFSSSLRGNLVVLPNAPVRLNLNYSIRNTQVETPIDVARPDTVYTPPADTTYGEIHTGVINKIFTNNKSVDATVRLRVDNDRYLDLNGSAGQSGNQSGTGQNGGGKATIRWTLFGWAIDSDYGDTRETTNNIRRLGGGGYDEQGTSRLAEATLVRNFGTQIVGRIIANIGLDRYRYTVFSDSATPPSPRDAYRQLLRTEMNYNPSQKVSSRVAAQVSLNRTINISAATTGSNTDTRSYRGEWSWTYRLLPSLTVTQNNQIQADYQQYPFSPDRNSLALNYNNSTTMSAALPGNFSIDVANNTSAAPRGAYTLQTDGLNSLALSDNTQNYGLTAAVRYTPFTGVSVHVDPQYNSTDRSGTVNGQQAKQRTDKGLNFSGGVDINIRVGAKGTLTGRLARTYTDQRTINYSTAGVPAPTPASQTDYWNGNLQLTWTL